MQRRAGPRPLRIAVQGLQLLVIRTSGLTGSEPLKPRRCQTQRAATNRNDRPGKPGPQDVSAFGVSCLDLFGIHGSGFGIVRHLCREGREDGNCAGMSLGWRFEVLSLGLRR